MGFICLAFTTFCEIKASAKGSSICFEQNSPWKGPAFLVSDKLIGLKIGKIRQQLSHEPRAPCIELLRAIQGYHVPAVGVALHSDGLEIQHAYSSSQISILASG
mmetsp:Transcript_19970/g.32186  ORF Transcript_19970/g.32186 Transcript_19970/m.32186 type:complete len:104 (-) Transcript_19970:17-328(-)